MSPNCLEDFGIEPVKKVNKIIEKVKQNQKEKYKNTFLDFLYIYKIYYPKNLYTIDNNNTSLKIQMIDRKEEEFIEIKNISNKFKYFKYNNKVFIISSNKFILYFFRNNFILLNKKFEVIHINSSKFTGIPIHKNNISPIPSINIPKKILESYGVPKNSSNNISLFFNIFNEKFFICFWKTNLYIDNNSFFIQVGNEKYFFNKELEYIIPNIKQPQEEIKKQENKNTLLDFLPEYPNINKENNWSLKNSDITLDYKEMNQKISFIFSPIQIHDKIFQVKTYKKYYIQCLYENHVKFKIYNNFVVPCQQIKDNIFSIGNYYNLYISDTILKFKYFIEKNNNENINIYYNILLDYFFIILFNMNFYIPYNTLNPEYFIIIYNNKYIFDDKLNLKNNILEEKKLNELSTSTSSSTSTDVIYI